MQGILYDFVSILSTFSNSCSEQILFQRQMWHRHTLTRIAMETFLLVSFASIGEYSYLGNILCSCVPPNLYAKHKQWEKVNGTYVLLPRHTIARVGDMINLSMLAFSYNHILCVQGYSMEPMGAFVLS